MGHVRANSEDGARHEKTDRHGNHCRERLRRAAQRRRMYSAVAAAKSVAIRAAQFQVIGVESVALPGLR